MTRFGRSLAAILVACAFVSAQALPLISVESCPAATRHSCPCGMDPSEDGCCCSTNPTAAAGCSLRPADCGSGTRDVLPNAGSDLFVDLAPPEPALTATRLAAHFLPAEPGAPPVPPLPPPRLRR